MASKQTPSVKISNPKLTDITSDSITVTWKPQIKGISETKVHFQVAAEGHFPDGGVFRRVDAPKKNTYTFTGLRERTVYSFYIIALDETDEELKQYPEDEDDEPLTDITKAIDVTAPSVASRKLTVVNRFADGFVIQWTKAKDKVSAQKDISYECWMKEAGSSLNAKKIKSQKDTDSFRITGLKSGTQYAFYVLAIDEAGNSIRYPDDGRYETVETLDTVAPEVKDPKISVVEFTQDSISIQWEPVTDNDTSRADILYQIYLKEATSPKADWGDPVRSDYGIVSHTFDDLKSCTRYLFRVIAYDKSGNPCEYKTQEETTSDREAPQVDNNTLKVTRVTKDSVTVIWAKAYDNVTRPEKIRYQVSYKNVNKTNDTWHVVDKLPNIDTYTFKNLSPDTNYAFQVTAMDESYNPMTYSEVRKRTLTDKLVNKISYTIEQKATVAPYPVYSISFTVEYTYVKRNGNGDIVDQKTGSREYQWGDLVPKSDEIALPAGYYFDANRIYVKLRSQRATRREDNNWKDCNSGWVDVSKENLKFKLTGGFYNHNVQLGGTAAEGYSLFL